MWKKRACLINQRTRQMDPYTMYTLLFSANSLFSRPAGRSNAITAGKSILKRNNMNNSSAASAADWSCHKTCQLCALAALPAFSRTPNWEALTCTPVLRELIKCTKVRWIDEVDRSIYCVLVVKQHIYIQYATLWKVAGIQWVCISSM